MKISEQINEDIKTAMKAREKVALEALRAAKTAFILARTQEGAHGDLSEDEELKCIQKLVKQRKESADIYSKQARQDLADKELAEASVLESYLPAKMSRDELVNYLKVLIGTTGAQSSKDMGRVMGVATKELAGKADGKDIAAIVKELLG